MNYPKSNTSTSYRISVPALSGGVNLSAGLNFVADDQLTACKNLYWKDGALRTRPGFQKQRAAYVPAASKWLFNGPAEWKGEPARCVVTERTEPDGKVLLDIIFFTADGAGHTTFPLTLAPMEWPQNVLVFSGRPTKAKGTGMYIFVGLQASGRVFEYADLFWDEITEDEAYAPLVLVNGKGNKYASLPADEKTEAAPASLFEGYNTLFGRFRASYFTDGKSWEFRLPTGGLADKDIEIQFLEQAKFHFTIKAGETDSPTVPLLANAFARADRDTGLISILHHVDGETDIPFPLPMNENVSNTLVVTASLPVDAVGAEKQGSPFRMKRAQWFGASALSDGSRLFLTGDPSAPGLVRWSDCASPLYFPENNYAQIGDASQVTAMARQEDMLVFFKPGAIYATTYVEGNSYTADDLLAGTVFDVTAVSASFPIKQLHPSIGCDLPDTVQLCDNRLVFTHSDGGIYVLSSSNPYSENNVYCLSYPVKSVIPTEGRLFAADWDGYYLLFEAGKDLPGYKILLMDYRSYGFRYASSYARHKTDAPFFIWENLNAIGDANHICVIQNDDFVGEEVSITPFLLQGKTDHLKNDAQGSPVQLPIEAELRTKLFDFDRPERQKRISSLHIGVGGDGEMELFFITERGETPAVRKKTLYTDKEPGEAGYIQTLSVLSAAPRVKQFGVGIRSTGIAAFDGIRMQYKMMR